MKGEEDAGINKEQWTAGWSAWCPDLCPMDSDLFGTFVFLLRLRHKVSFPCGFLTLWPQYSSIFNQLAVSVLLLYYRPLYPANSIQYVGNLSLRAWSWPVLAIGWLFVAMPPMLEKLGMFCVLQDASRLYRLVWPTISDHQRYVFRIYPSFISAVSHLSPDNSLYHVEYWFSFDISLALSPLIFLLVNL